MSLRRSTPWRWALLVVLVAVAVGEFTSILVLERRLAEQRSRWAGDAPLLLRLHEGALPPLPPQELSLQRLYRFQDEVQSWFDDFMERHAVDAATRSLVEAYTAEELLRKEERRLSSLLGVPPGGEWESWVDCETTARMLLGDEVGAEFAAELQSRWQAFGGSTVEEEG